MGEAKSAHSDFQSQQENKIFQLKLGIVYQGISGRFTKPVDLIQ